MPGYRSVTPQQKNTILLPWPRRSLPRFLTRDTKIDDDPFRAVAAMSGLFVTSTRVIVAGTVVALLVAYSVPRLVGALAAIALLIGAFSGAPAAASGRWPVRAELWVDAVTSLVVTAAAPLALGTATPTLGLAIGEAQLTLTAFLATAYGGRRWMLLSVVGPTVLVLSAVQDAPNRGVLGLETAIAPLAAAVAGLWVHNLVRLEAARLQQLAEQSEFEARTDALQRHKMMMHDHASLLSMLAQELPNDVAASARREAARAAAEIRTFVRTGGLERHRPSKDLKGLIDDVAIQFVDLDIETLTALAADHCIPLTQMAPLREAVRTLLHNVRNHSQTRTVIVHADVADGCWEIVVRDDGCGFDVATTPMGFGLRDQVFAALESVGVEVTLTSAPGEGTVVMMTGALAGPTR